MSAVSLTDAVPVDGLTTELVRRTAVTLAAAEAAGIARWCLATAVEHAKVREQFGRPIGSFQAVKHLCAEMLETAETVTAAAWDAAAVPFGDDDQWAWAADVAGAVAFDGAVRNAQACIQVLGGIGFTFEHEAHFYLRRATALRSLLGGSDGFAASLAAAGRRGHPTPGGGRPGRSRRRRAGRRTTAGRRDRRPPGGGAAGGARGGRLPHAALAGAATASPPTRSPSW